MAKSLIVITGAAGMIGSGVVRHLNDLGHEDLILVDQLGTGKKWKNLVGKKFIDIFSQEKLFDLLQGESASLKAVIHLGACSDTTESDADYLIENNFHLTTRLASASLHAGARFIYASSAATYGDGTFGFVDDEDRLDELRPLNMYGYSKHLADLWMKQQGLLDQVVGLKYFNIFGPNENEKGNMASFIFKKTPEANSTGKVSLFKSNDPENFADGEQARDFLYVKDAVRMTCAFLDGKTDDANGIYNIGLGKTTTWNQIVSYLFDALKKKGEISYIDMPKQLEGQYQNFTCADMRKFYRTFPQIEGAMEVSDAITEYVQDYLLTSQRW